MGTIAVCKATVCDGGHFEVPLPGVCLRIIWARTAPQEIEMARAVKMTKTRVARWINAFRQSRYYDTME